MSRFAYTQGLQNYWVQSLKIYVCWVFFIFQFQFFIMVYTRPSMFRLPDKLSKLFLTAVVQHIKLYIVTAIKIDNYSTK